MLHTLHLPVALHAPWSGAEPQVAVSCHLQAGVGREWLSHKDFPFFQLQPGLAVQFSAHQQPPTSLPCSATVSFPMHLFPQVEGSPERWGRRLAFPQHPQRHPAVPPHSHRQAGEGAIAEEQVRRGEGSDAELLHELLLAAQHPPHRNVLVLQHVQGHLQAPRSGGGAEGIPQPHQGVPCVTSGTG